MINNNDRRPLVLCHGQVNHEHEDAVAKNLTRVKIAFVRCPAAAESSMNVHIRRSRALEAMQAEYDRKAREYEEIKAARQKLEAVGGGLRDCRLRNAGDGGREGSSCGAMLWVGVNG